MVMKFVVLLFFGCAGLAFVLTDARGDSFVEFDYNIFTGTRIRSSLFVQLYDDRPLTTANFLQYVNSNLYNNSLVHRFALDGNNSPFVLQGGGYYPRYIDEPATPLRRSLDPTNVVPTGPAVSGEYNNVPLHSNVKGSLAMALVGNPPNTNSATSQYFFNLQDNTQNLDGAFTVFGQVAGDGMSLIDGYEASNNLYIVNMNPDTNDDGTPDGGPFTQTPIVISGNTFAPLILSRARVVDYLGSGATTDVPPGGLTFANKDAFIDTGTVFTGTGTLTIGVGRTLGVRENYAINRDLINHGFLAPGLSLGVMGVQGNYFQYSDGLLNIQLAGTTVDTEYDRLISSGIAFLAGRLQVSFLNSFAPAIGNSFTVLTAQSIVGGFTSYDLPQLPSGKLWNISQSSIAVTLTVVDDSGDFNKDGVVDSRDYIYWRKTNGTPAAFQLWRNGLGNRSGGVFAAGSTDLSGGLVSGSVPEPSAGFLTLAAVVFFGIMRRRKARA
jgi:cyclophilin family peptidyl-prolyl cis-trans isomerase